MKTKKDQKKAKQGRPVKELLPPGFNKPLRESLPLPPLDLVPSQFLFNLTPAQICPPWPGDDTAQSQDFGLSSSNQFEDDFEYSFPPSFYEFCTNGKPEWQWPEETSPNESNNKPSGRRNTGKKIPPLSGTPKDQSKAIEEFEEDRVWSVVTYSERDETAEELETRRQKELEKFLASKKKGKPEEVHICKIKEVKLANLDFSKKLPICCRWIASQLQVLKDKDWSSAGEHIWSKIYPQKDGIPVYNPSGKYWVKLMLFGSYKLVEIDARVLALDGSFLFPRSANFRDLWATILSKAYYKLYSFKWRNTSKFLKNLNEELDGSFIYSITGMVPQYQLYDYIGEDEWKNFEHLLSDENWDHNYNLISVYSRTHKDSQPLAKSFLEEDQSKSVEDSAQVKPKKNSNLIQGFAYLITDVFANSKDFDMRKILKKEKLRLEEDVKNLLMKARASSPARKLKRHQSPARIRELQKRKARRGKEREEKRQKLLETREFPVFKLIRVKSGASGVGGLGVDSGFSNQEIEEARLRNLNKEYFKNKDLEELERIMDAEDAELFDPKDSFEINVEKILKEEKMEGVVCPKQRCQGGVWYSSDDFPQTLKEYLVYHDISHFPYRLTLDDIWKDKGLPYIHNQNFDVLLIENNGNQKIQLVVAFAPIIPEGTIPASPLLSLQKFDFEREEVVNWPGEVRLETSSISAQFYLIEESNLVLRPLVLNSPCGYIAWVSSSVPISTMSRQHYLVDKLGWNHIKFTFDYPFLSKGYFYLPFKIEINSDDPQGVMIKVSSSDPNMLQFGKLILIDRDQGVNELDYKYLDIAVLETKRISLPPNSKGYRLLLLLFSPVNLPDGTLNLDIVSKSGSLKAIPGEMMDPVEYSDRYLPNKHGILFKEQLFVPEDVHFSLHVRIRKGGLPLPGGKAKEIPAEEHLTTSHLLFLEIYDGDELIIATQGSNQVIIPHLNLKTNSKELLIVCKFDINEWPDCKSSAETQDLNWVLRLIASDTVVIVKDTRKEDKEDIIRKSWESAQPGRADQAKQSRLRYLALMKSAKNEELTEQEKELVKETWQERRKAKKELETAGKGKGKGKEDKKQKEPEKPQICEVEIPSPEEHFMAPIKKFLAHLQADRVVRAGDNQVLLITSSVIEQEKVKIKNDISHYNEVYLQRKTDWVQQKARLNSFKESFKEMAQSKKESIESSVALYKEARSEYQNKIEVKKK